MIDVITVIPLRSHGRNGGRGVFVVARLVDVEEESGSELTGEEGERAGRMGFEDPGLSQGLGGDVRLIVPPKNQV